MTHSPLPSTITFILMVNMGRQRLGLPQEYGKFIDDISFYQKIKAVKQLYIVYVYNTYNKMLLVKTLII